jgi:hypothetical protein
MRQGTRYFTLATEAEGYVEFRSVIPGLEGTVGRVRGTE